MQKIWIAIVVLFVLGLSPQAFAGTFNERGKLVLDEEANISFDSDKDVELFAVDSQGREIDVANNWISNEDGLEGEGALQLGGTVFVGAVILEGKYPKLAGKRAEITLWYKTQGSEPSIVIRWHSGDTKTYLTRDRGAAVPMGFLAMHPTGKKTTDGWVQMSTGPFDWQLGGVKDPAFLRIADKQYVQSFDGRSYTFDPVASFLVDGLEIKDLGPAKVPKAECKGDNEKATCGEHGVCSLGKCVDGAAILGSAPNKEIRKDYVERLLQELNVFLAVRAGRTKLPEIRNIWMGAMEKSTKDFWYDIRRGHELSIDGHGYPPTMVWLEPYHNSGICLGPGQADLLPGDKQAMVPMVFKTNPMQHPISRDLQQGDVLRTIDGVDVKTWMKDQSRYFYYNGDVRGRDVILLRSIIKRAMTLGAKLAFERCEKPQDGQITECDAGSAKTIEIDFGKEYAAPLWEDNIGIPWLFEQCDMRFKPAAAPGPRDEVYSFAGWRDIDNVRHLVFNGFPDIRWGNGAAWKQFVDQALSSGPEFLIIDQRLGMGGWPDYLLGQTLAPNTMMYSDLIPWVGGEPDDSLKRAYQDCARASNYAIQGCGLFYPYFPTYRHQPAGAQNSKLALINAYDVSGNDYYSRFLSMRKAETKIFGYSPTIGAYGVGCRFPEKIGEIQSMAYQCQDSRFFGEGSDEKYESGTGVMPDETVYQKQSDALDNKDTILEAATTWLKQGATQ